MMFGGVRVWYLFNEGEGSIETGIVLPADRNVYTVDLDQDNARRLKIDQDWMLHLPPHGHQLLIAS
jgi:hypothetical protein